MSTLSTTRMSSKGQVVIPEEIRRELKLKPGSQFVVVGGNGVVVLKAISSPSMEEFEGLIAEAQKRARKAGLRSIDIRTAIAKVRARR